MTDQMHNAWPLPPMDEEKDMDELDGMLAYARAIANPSRDDPSWPLPSFDAHDWVEAFGKHFVVSHVDGRPLDDQGELMLAWFANALMRGYDERCRIAADG